MPSAFNARRVKLADFASKQLRRKLKVADGTYKGESFELIETSANEAL